MSELLLDAAGRRRSPAALPDFHAGRLAKLSTNSIHRTVARATHQSLIDDKSDAAQSSRAIDDVVSAVQRSG